jgi:hypothetical protein
MDFPIQHCDFQKKGGSMEFIDTYSLCIGGWWLTYPSENMKVSWDDEIPNQMEK